ncbi:MAG: transcription antitermination factor NusB, partial [bacterium]
MKRRQSRDLAFQLVYAMEMSSESKESVVKRFSAVSSKMDSGEAAYALQLFDWTLEMIPDLNDSLKPIVEHWSL